MLRAARRAPSTLLEARERVVIYLRGQFNEDGGARDRAGRSDLYYTVFALESLEALGAERPLEPVLRYLQTFADGDDCGVAGAPASRQRRHQPAGDLQFPGRLPHLTQWRNFSTKLC